MIHIAIVEDEWQCAEELQQQLLTYSEEYGVEFNIICMRAIPLQATRWKTASLRR